MAVVHGCEYCFFFVLLSGSPFGLFRPELFYDLSHLRVTLFKTNRTAMKYRIREVTVVLGEMDVARAKPKPRPGWTHIPAGGHFEVASVPVDDVHQACIT